MLYGIEQGRSEDDPPVHRNRGILTRMLLFEGLHLALVESVRVVEGHRAYCRPSSSENARLIGANITLLSAVLPILPYSLAATF